MKFIIEGKEEQEEIVEIFLCSTTKDRVIISAKNQKTNSCKDLIIMESGKITLCANAELKGIKTDKEGRILVHWEVSRNDKH